jgi:Rrf2 family protein
VKLITRDTDYAARAVCFIAKQKGRLVSVSELVEALKVPYSFLRKQLQLLNNKGILKSFKGKGGGFQLAIPAQKLYLIDLIKVFQGDFSLNECLLKKKVCPEKGSCVLRKKILAIEKYVVDQLSSITLADLQG